MFITNFTKKELSRGMLQKELWFRFVTRATKRESKLSMI